MTAMDLRVNGEVVRASVLAREAEALRQRFARLSDEQRQKSGLEPGALDRTAVEWARENVIEQVLLRQAACKDAKPLDQAEVEKQLSGMISSYGGRDKLAEAGLDEAAVRTDIETGLRVADLVRSITSHVKPPRTKELATFYRRNKDRYRTEETVRAAHIVKHVEKGVSEAEARQSAERLHARLQAGTSFEQIADEESDCPGNGGDLGYFPRGRMVKEFEDVVFGLPVDAVSGVFQTRFGFHIAKVLDRKPKGLRQFRDVQDEIREELVQDRRTELLEDFVDQLRFEAVIEG